ncbi:MAG: ATP-binding cassette transporter snq2, partial [Watsoniomyces obsoletus]
GFVQQQDVHLPESTVREALRFSATLRQPKDVSIQEKYAYVEKVIDILEMQDFAGAVIGVPGSGLDVEQRKKTTIGIELVAKPDLVLFLDEPTSGLDSQSAWSIVRTLRKLVNSGQTILCTIHQPSSILFEQFDHLLLLQKGGKTAYFGDIGDSSRTVIDYFESNGAFQCPGSANPAEYILDVVGAGVNS